MQSAVWLSSIFGPLLFILGLWMLAYGENLSKVFTSMKNTPSAFYISSVINLLLGLVIISHHNVWMWNATFFLTLLGWVFLIRGIMGLYIPQLMFKMMSNSFMKIMGIIPLIWGVILCWVAFFM